MSDLTTPQGEGIDETEEVQTPRNVVPAASQDEEVKEVEQVETEEAQRPRNVVPNVGMYEANDDDSDSDDDRDDDDSDADDDDASSPEGPAEYVQREKSGRGRRIGGEVRPDDVDYKNIPLLSRFLDRRGRILSRRKTRVSAKVQRRIVQAIKRARHLALLPYTADQTRIVRRRR
jgi:small subunit ribosomal protein S18